MNVKIRLNMEAKFGNFLLRHIQQFQLSGESNKLIISELRLASKRNRKATTNER